MLQTFALLELPSHIHGLLFFSSAEANLPVQVQVVNVTYHGVNPLPVGLGGSNSLTLL